MFPANFLIAERIDCGAQASSKKRALEAVARLLATAHPELTPEKVFDQLLERERLGSTGLGHGVALPHARMQGLDAACGAFLRLDQGIDYDAIDGAPVDLLFGLLVPQEATQEHLQLLANLASLFGDSQIRSQLRDSRDAETVLRLLQRQKA